jgi:hypothetical protein
MNSILKSKIRIWIEISYIILLASFCGMIITTGAIVAPSIFGSEFIILTADLTNFQEGQLMSDIFLKCSSVTVYIVFMVLLYELYDYKTKGGDKIISFLTFVFISSSLMFVAYYMPSILEIQSLGEVATKSTLFKELHYGSELIFKIMLISLLALIFRRMFFMRIS